MTLRNLSPHQQALIALCLVWILFFWRVWTPLDADRVSFAEGDFSAQFVTWTDYALERLSNGEIPQWNPYQYGGAPFQASSQTALTYPPRMVTLGVLLLLPEPTIQTVYTALQWEVMLHILAVSLFFYGFMRALLREQPDLDARSIHWGAMLASLTFSYGAYLAGFPILQLPLLESAIWLPLILWCILWATANDTIRWAGIVAAAAILGICLLAGHPQTAWFTILMAVFWMGYRLNWSWRVWFTGVIMLGAIAGALAAVQLIPTAEFTQYTYRTELSFAGKGGGYNFEELANLLFPIRGKIWNSIYLGIIPLIMVGVGMVRNIPHARFFGGIILVAGLLSFGTLTPVYGWLYVVLPGLSFFRGQERAIFMIAYSVAILFGISMAYWIKYREAWLPALEKTTLALSGIAVIYGGVLYILAQTDQRSVLIVDRYHTAIFSLMVLGGLWFGIRQKSATVIALVLIFDLFATTAMLEQNYEERPTSTRITEPHYLQTVLDNLPAGDRVDTKGAIADGYGTAYRLADINGSDPLQLESSQFFLEQVPLERRYDLLSVRVALQPQNPETAIELFGGTPPIWLLNDPRGFGRVLYQVAVADSVETARALTLDPSLDVRQVAVVEGLSDAQANTIIPSATDSPVTITHFDPEHITLQTNIPEAALLSLSLPYFPGWSATINGAETDIYRAYGGLSAVYLPTSGEYTVELQYQSRALMPTATVSLLAWISIMVFLIYEYQKIKR